MCICVADSRRVSAPTYFGKRCLTDFTMIFSIDDPALVADQLEPSPNQGEDVVVDAQQIIGASAAGSAKEEPSSLRTDWAIQASTFNSRLLLRRGDNVAILGKGNVSVKL